VVQEELETCTQQAETKVCVCVSVYVCAMDCV